MKKDIPFIATEGALHLIFKGTDSVKVNFLSLKHVEAFSLSTQLAFFLLTIEFKLGLY